MSEDVFFNVDATATPAEVDEINSGFYGRFNYPWIPLLVPSYEDPGFWMTALNQDLGQWGRPRLGGRLRIWVAGCGTNQAALTALRFPDADVVGSDVSARSLAACERIAAQIGIANLTLRNESLNATAYEGEFDYVVCTGVIHHNADPSIPLRSLARALKRDGVLELMVYNYYHRVQTTAFQKAIRILGGSGGRPDVDRELPMTRSLIASFPVDNAMKAFLEAQRGAPEAAVADSLLQPVEYSYTVRTLVELAASVGLEMLTHCVNQFDRLSGSLDWNLHFDEPELRRTYEALPDLERWQVSNLLMGERSPMLWFYLQRGDSAFPRRSEGEIGKGFLDAVFERAGTLARNWVLRDGARFERAGAAIPCPAPKAPADPAARLVFDAVDGRRPMRAVLRELGIEAEPREVNRLRVLLATSGFPYLRAVAD